MNPSSPMPPTEADPLSEAEEGPISVQVDEPFAVEVDAADLRAAIAATLASEGRPDGEVTLVITSDDAVAGLNEQYRGVTGPTDVLSFPAQEPVADQPGMPQFVTTPGMAAYLGDIVIALPYTRRQAVELGRSLRDELRLLAVHGTLHLLGYDHAEPEEEAEMWTRQDVILQRMG